MYQIKRGGKIKGRAFTGGNKQRGFISKEESSSPRVATEAVLLSCVIYAQEHRGVDTIEIPNAFIKTRVEKIEDITTIIVQGAIIYVPVEIA